MAKDSETYNEETGKKLIKAYNEAIDKLLTSKEDKPEKLFEIVTSEFANVVAIGAGVENANSEYLGQVIADENLEEMFRAIGQYKVDRNSGLNALARASNKVHSKLISPYIKGYAKQEGIKPEKNEERDLETAVNDLYKKWITPEEEKKRLQKAA